MSSRRVASACLVFLLPAFACACSSKKASDRAIASSARAAAAADTNRVLTGAEAFGDWTTDAPGVKRKITPADMPKPYDTESARNGSRGVPRPAGALPKVPPGFAVGVFADGFDNPRHITTAPNGDVFIVESNPGHVQLLRDTNGDGRSDSKTTFVEGLKKPFGLAFYPSNDPHPKWVYVANTDSVVRYPYENGDNVARGAAETVVADLPSGGEEVGGGGHWTRDVVFSADRTRMFVSIGSRSNASDDDSEARRARILSFTPEGKDEQVFASGIRNPVGLAIDPSTGTLWASVNERDELGDNLVPDYVTSVKQGGFYGWPWFYIGANQDPRHAGKKPELATSITVPDVLLQSHSASLGMTFYDGKQFPDSYAGSAFAAEHGSWNRAKRTGYKVIRIPVVGGKAVGTYEDFLTGFVTDDGEVWGRPVGIGVAKDGALLVSDDQSNTVWRVAFER